MAEGAEQSLLPSLSNFSPLAEADDRHGTHLLLPILTSVSIFTSISLPVNLIFPPSPYASSLCKQNRQTGRSSPPVFEGPIFLLLVPPAAERESAVPACTTLGKGDAQNWEL